MPISYPSTVNNEKGDSKNNFFSKIRSKLLKNKKIANSATSICRQLILSYMQIIILLSIIS